MMKPKICVITTSLKAGGAERFVSEWVNHLDKDRYDVHVVLLSKQPQFYALHERITVHEPGFDAKKMNKLAHVIHLRRFLRTKVCAINPNTIFNVGYNSLSIFFLLGLKYPLYISNRSNPLKERPVWYRIIRRLMYVRATGMLAQTRLAQQYFARHTGQKNIIVIPNFIREMPDVQPGIQNREIISVGRYISTKNFEALIRIFAKLNAPDWKLVLVGDGPLRQKLETIASSLGVSDRVVFTGFQSDVDVFLQKASIFAFPSLSEGYPNALMEGMATPLPCVSYDCNAGPSDLIKDGENGFLVPLNDEELFAQRVQELIDNPSLRTKLAQNAVSIRQTHHIDTISSQILELILPTNGK